jgi:hypothetical protein
LLYRERSGVRAIWKGERRIDGEWIQEQRELIRLVVMYNLSDGADEGAFLDWRLKHHQNANAALPGVLRTDFARVVKAWPDQAVPRFRFATILEWRDMETFQRAFYAPSVQAELRENIKRLGEHEYSICEILTSSDIAEDAQS